MTKEDMLQYGVRSIRLVRKEKKISQMDLCLKANMSQSFLTAIETGKKEPSTMTLIRIASALDVSPNAFFPKSESNPQYDAKGEIKKEIIKLVSLL